MIRLYAALALASALAAAVWWARNDAVADYQAAQEAAAAKARAGHIAETTERRDDAKNLGDDELLDALSRWVLPTGPD